MLIPTPGSLQNLHTHTRTTHETHHAHTKHVPNTHTCTHSPKPHACNTRPHTHTHGANLTKQPNRHCSKRGERRSHAIRERDGSDRQRRQRRHSGVRGGTLPGQHVSGVRDAPPMPQHGLSEPAPHRVRNSHADERGEARCRAARQAHHLRSACLDRRGSASPQARKRHASRR